MGYLVIGLDIDGFDIAGGNEWDTLAEARRNAKGLVKEKEAIVAGLYKVEIRNAETDDCIDDYFVEDYDDGNG
jgi:hypothetical protein